MIIYTKILNLFIFVILLGWAQLSWGIGSCERITARTQLKIYGLSIPELKTETNGNSYFVFKDFEHAIKFLQEGHLRTKEDLAKRTQLLVPTIGGIWELISTSDAERVSDLRTRMHLRGSITMWINTLIEIKSSSSLIGQNDLEKLYQLASRLTGSYLYQPSHHPTVSGDISSIYFSLNRPPPQKQIERWINAYKTSLKSVARYKMLNNSLYMIPLLPLSDLERAELANIWLRQEAIITNQGEAPSPSLMINSLKQLFLISPPAALKYFKRHRAQFLASSIQGLEMLIRPLMHFMYVLKEEFPNIYLSEITNSFFEEEKDFGSYLEKNVDPWLSDLGIPFEENIFDPVASNIEMDRFLVLDNGRKINIEIDGPQHFILNGDGSFTQRLADRRRDEILNALGIEVFRISYLDLLPEAIDATEESLMEFLINDEAADEQ